MRWISFSLILLGAVGLSVAEPFKEVEVSPQEITDSWWQDYTIRLKPQESATYDDIVFECVLHQEFPWKNADGEAYTKTNEPAFFTYKRHAVKLVADLDHYISFKIPYGVDHLKQMYGDKLFNADAPVIVSAIRIFGVNGGKRVWKMQVSPTGLCVPKATALVKSATNALASTNAPASTNVSARTTQPGTKGRATH